MGINNKSEHSLKTNPQSPGFTIIEVMIVLAVAGMILLIVFLAVPSLQRAARNHGRKADVARLYDALNHYVDDHPELTIAAGPNQILLSTGKIFSNKGQTGNLSQINNRCDTDAGSDLSPADRASGGDAIGNRSEECSDDDTETLGGVYVFRENDPLKFHGVLGPYVNNGAAYGPDTVHILIGGVCDPAKPGDPTGPAYTYFHEDGNIHEVAIAYALETGGAPQVFCNDYSI